MKRIVTIFLVLAMMALLIACGGEEEFKIPDVFGVNFSDATDVLEADGFEVKAIETSVGPISNKLTWPLESVEKGSVFKIDDYIKDGFGELVKGSDEYYDGELISNDKSIVVYYAKEDYIFDDEEYTDDETTSYEEDENSQQTNQEESTDTTSVVSENSSTESSIDSDFKSAMDSYEKFMNDYVEFMKKYKANPSDLSLLADYASFMSDYADYVEDFSEWEDEDLNTSELAYYIDVQTRVNKKLLEVAQ